MMGPVLSFSLSAAGIVVAGVFLTRFANAIADLTRVGKVLAGPVLLAMATSLPELSVGISAVRRGWVDLAVGNLLGACLINLLILGVLDMLSPSRGRMLSRVSAAHALSATMSITLLSLAGVFILLPAAAGTSFLGIGAGLWIVIGAYLLGMRVVYVDQRVSAGEVGQDVAAPASGMRLWQAVAGFALCAVVIVALAPSLARSAARLAESSGLGETFVGTAFLAICTTLPELVTGITAVRMGALQLALGNAIGSIAFNIILLAPIDVFYSGSLLSDASEVHAVTAFLAILIMAIAVMGQLYHVERRRHLLEPDALLVILLVAAALAMVRWLS